jgi:phosphate transport system substrate-binding protein
VHRADGSGTTGIFTGYLSSVSASWSAKAVHDLTVNWPTGIGAVGSQNVLRDVLIVRAVVIFGRLVLRGTRSLEMPRTST